VSDKVPAAACTRHGDVGAGNLAAHAVSEKARTAAARCKAMFALFRNVMWPPAVAFAAVLPPPEGRPMTRLFAVIVLDTPVAKRPTRPPPYGAEMAGGPATSSGARLTDAPPDAVTATPYGTARVTPSAVVVPPPVAVMRLTGGRPNRCRRYW
jgi:hypothetical protein